MLFTFGLFILASVVHCLTQDDVLRVGYFVAPDGVIATQDDNNVTRITGVYVDLAKWIGAYQKKTYSLVELENLESFNAISNEIHLKGIDITLPVYSVTAERMKVATFLFPVQTDTYTLIVPYPKRESDPWSCLKPFSTSSFVWLCIIACVIGISILLRRSALAKEKRTGAQKILGFTSVSNTSMYVVGVLTNQGGYCESKTRTTRFLSAIWCLAALVLVNAYSSLLITYLTAPKLSLLVESIEELAKRDDLQVLVQKGTFIRRQLENVEGTLKRIRTNMERLPDDYCGTPWESKEEKCFKDVENGGFVMVSVNSISHYPMQRTEALINGEFKKSKTCTKTYLQNTFFFGIAGFIAPSNISHELRSDLDVSILRAVSYGLLEKFKSFYSGTVKSPCARFRSQSQDLKKLSLIDFISALIILGMGFVLSFTACTFEVVTARRLKGTRQ